MKTAKQFLKAKRLKDTLYNAKYNPNQNRGLPEKEWINGGLSALLDEYANSKVKNISINPDVKRSVKPRYWVCIIGETEWNDLPNGADSPMRTAVEKEFKKVTGHDAPHNWSGWSADIKTVDKILKVWNK